MKSKLHYLFLVLALLAAVNQAAAQTSFVLSTNYTVGANPGGLAVADVNGDGKPDMITASYSDNMITVMTNNGSGVFVTNATYPANGVAFIVAADVNGDGKTDLIYSSVSNNILVVLTNNGSGMFMSNATYNLPGTAYDFVAADVNGDNKVDLIAACYNGSVVTVLTNKGDGTFQVSGNINVGSQYPRWIAVADLNRDGRPDLAVADYYTPHALAILTNSGGGNFIYASSIVISGWAFGVAAADVNGDGWPDLIGSGGGGGNLLAVCTNNGNGAFTSSVNYPVGASPTCVVATNLGASTSPDLICANGATNTLSVLTNNGNGTFTLDTNLVVGNGPSLALAVDLNGDGKPDLICVNSSTNTVTVYLNTTINPTLLTNIVVSPANPVIGIGSNQQFTATGYFGDGSYHTLTNSSGSNLLWSSSSSNVASITANGIATGLTNGVTTIAATSGSVSGNATLTVVSPPNISMQPTNNTVAPGGSVTFNVSAAGGDLSYQWLFDGANISGATAPSLTVTNVNAGTIGVYSVIVSNAAGSITSASANLASVGIAMFAGVIVDGPIGSNYLIQSASSLNSTDWTTLTNVALPTQPYIYIDYTSPTNPLQFYRAVPQ
jgi:hypothetical protein